MVPLGVVCILGTVGIVSSAVAAPFAGGCGQGAGCQVMKPPYFFDYPKAKADLSQLFSLPGSGIEGGLSPSDLRSAYALGTATASGQTVAIVDAFDDPNAESNMNTYRAVYGLPGCTSSSGCFRKVNQEGGTSYPPPNEAWAGEISLDVDMVSAVCPTCKILLVEASTASTLNLGLAENEAVALGATEISNSYGSVEVSGDSGYNKYYSHPGIPITVATGDSGYNNFLLGGSAPSYPAAAPGVISVGGTVLENASNARGWNETGMGVEEFLNGEGRVVKLAPGNGCSIEESKPKWQTDTGCARRTTADIAAVASHRSPVSVYDTFGAVPGWVLATGTSVGAPIVAAILAQSPSAVRSAAPEVPYLAAKRGTGSLADINTGPSNYSKTCSPTYLCNYASGYDAPSGSGSPIGPLSIASWTLSHPASPSGNAELNGVGCSAVSACTAVGYNANLPLVERWGGSTWSSQAAVVPTGSVSAPLYQAACPSASNCYTAGYWLNSEFVAHPLVEVWAGSTWSLQSVGSPAGATGTYGNGLSCPVVGACMTAGFYTSPSGILPFAARLSGGTWTVETPPAPAGSKEAFLYEVSCLGASECIAVGSSHASGKGVPFADRWNGTSWLLQSVPAPSGAISSGLEGVSCSSSAMCMAVGSQRNATGVVAPLTEWWNGSSWAIQATPAVGEVVLTGVSCVSSTACSAVGSTQPSGAPSLMLRWNGVEWQKQPSPEGAVSTSLASVFCSARTTCIAVGRALTTPETTAAEIYGE
jgi:hypothetical protein